MFGVDGAVRRHRQVAKTALPRAGVLIASQHHHPLAGDAILVKVTQARHRAADSTPGRGIMVDWTDDGAIRANGQYRYRDSNPGFRHERAAS